jgi:hypothetical protein
VEYYAASWAAISAMKSSLPLNPAKINARDYCFFLLNPAYRAEKKRIVAVYRTTVIQG